MEADVKGSLADLTKLPAKEFEQHFQEWMERDEVARALQAKLRFDLIKNFNKTHLGKQMMVQNLYSNVNGSAYRLTLSPLILSLNTLVAEFLYASNCHYALSVFCTEVQYRNVLPNFERMKDFRFNDLEIRDLWEAITGSSPYHKNLHRNVAKIYHAEYQNSLLLAVLKYLIKQRPNEMLKRTVDVQTDYRKDDCATQAISTQVSDSGDHVTSHLPLHIPHSKAKCKIHQEEGMTKFKKYIQILSHHVSVMIDKFDEFAELKKTLGRREHSKSIRFREYQIMGRNLERISQNIKLTANAKRRNRKQQMLLQAIENLTVEFNKCAEQFKDLQKDLKWKQEKIVLPKPSTQDKQTETIIVERSYDQWIFEMRNTTNGKKFLQRVEASLRKAMDKHKENVEKEMKIHLKHIRSVLKLRYKQKLLTCLSNQSFTDGNLEVHKLHENITKKLHEFELRQMEILEKMQETSGYSHRLNESENIGPSNLNITSEMLMHQVTTPIKNQNDKIYESKLGGLKELENECERIEKKFLNYLDRQKQENIQTDQVQNTVNTSTILDLIQKFQQKAKHLTHKSNEMEDNEDDDFLEMKQYFQQHFQRNEGISTTLKPQENVVSASFEESENAIRVAKEYFFEEKQRFRQNKLNELLQDMQLNIAKEDKLDGKFEMFYTNTKFDNHASSRDLLNSQIHNQQNTENHLNKMEQNDTNENCKKLNTIIETSTTTVTTAATATATVTTISATKTAISTAIATVAAATAATTPAPAVAALKLSQQHSLPIQDEMGETVLIKENSTVKIFKPLQLTRDNVKKVFPETKPDCLDDCLPKMEEVDIVKKTMNKIQKLFEENSTAIYKKNECHDTFLEVDTKSSRILSNFTKSLEEHLLPHNEMANGEDILTVATATATATAATTAATTTTTTPTSTNEKSTRLREMEKAQRILNISMPSFVDITSSTSSDNFESDVDIVTARPLIQQK